MLMSVLFSMRSEKTIEGPYLLAFSHISRTLMLTLIVSTLAFLCGGGEWNESSDIVVKNVALSKALYGVTCCSFHLHFLCRRFF